MKPLLPPGWPRPKGYANGVSARGRTIFTAGVVGWTEQQRFEARDLAGQFRQVLANILAILAEDGAGPEHIVRMTCYVTDVGAYRARLEPYFPPRRDGRVLFPFRRLFLVAYR